MMDQGNPSRGYVTNSPAINTMVQVRRERGKEPVSGVGLGCVLPLLPGQVTVGKRGSLFCSFADCQVAQGPGYMSESCTLGAGGGT